MERNDHTVTNPPTAAGAGDLDVERDSDVPISTQIFWQLAYQIDSGRLLPGARLAPVRELGAALRVNPNTIRAVYRRLADAGYDTAFAAATERKRPGALVHVLFAECTNADAGYDAARLNDAFPGQIEVEGTLLDDLPDRLERFHYDLVATTTFHADEAQALVHGRVPVVAMLVGPGYVELVHEIAGLKAGSRVGLVCASERGTENMAETLALSGTTGVELLSASMESEEDLALIDRTADVILLSREAIANGLAERFSRAERIRRWSYDFDPSGLELLRRAVEPIATARRTEAIPAGA